MRGSGADNRKWQVRDAGKVHKPVSSCFFLFLSVKVLYDFLLSSLTVYAIYTSSKHVNDFNLVCFPLNNEC